ncbi:MAG: class I SAM-dependent methyltransferase [Mariprofundaceae bacterium]
MRRIYVPFGDDEVYLGMNAAQRNRLIARHQKSVGNYGYAPEALFWGSRGEQKVRFKALAEIGISTGDSLLDVGCGFGDFYSWLSGTNTTVDYTGIDLSSDIVNEGSKVHSELRLLQGEIFDFDWPPQTFDWVFLSGTLNWSLGDHGDYARRVIQRMFKLCRVGVAFNMLDSRNLEDLDIVDLYAYDPKEVLHFCKQITPHCQYRDDYYDHDFTIYMKR